MGGVGGFLLKPNTQTLSSKVAPSVSLERLKNVSFLICKTTAVWTNKRDKFPSQSLAWHKCSKGQAFFLNFAEEDPTRPQHPTNPPHLNCSPPFMATRVHVFRWLRQRACVGRTKASKETTPLQCPTKTKLGKNQWTRTNKTKIDHIPERPLRRECLTIRNLLTHYIKFKRKK